MIITEQHEIIEIKQLPIIQEQLQQIKDDVTIRVNDALSLVCTEETVKSVKKVRADLNNELKSWEDKRKEVKKAIMSPYDQFEEVYKNCISDVFKNADAELKQKIADVENEQKNKKQKEVQDYFEEYKKASNIDFVDLSQARINVTLSASIKSLKEQAKIFIDHVSDDLKLIESQEHSNEIMVEYKQNGLNSSNAILTIVNRYKAIEEEKARQQAQEEAKQAEADAIAKVEEIATPVEAIAPPKVEEKRLKAKFTVEGTLEQLKAIKQYIIESGATIL